MSSKTIRRRQDIVFLNLLFCLLVIFIHVSSEIVLRMDHAKPMYWAVSTLSRLSGFSVYGFILLSGVKLFLKADSFRYGEFYLSRLVSIVLPYVFWVFVYYLYFCYKNTYVFSWWELGRFLLTGGISAQFYFIVVLLQFYLLTPVWMLLFKRVNPAVLLSVSLMITVMGGNSLTEILTLIFPQALVPSVTLLFPRYLFFWAAGCMIGRHYHAFQEYLHRRWFAITIFFAILLFAASVCHLRYPYTTAAWAEQLYLLYAMGALLFFYMLAQLFANQGAVLLRPFRFLDYNTYGMYLIHCLLLFMANDWLNAKGIADLSVRYAWRAIAAYGVGILLCLFWEYVLKPMLQKLLKKENEPIG